MSLPRHILWHGIDFFRSCRSACGGGGQDITSVEVYMPPAVDWTTTLTQIADMNGKPRWWVASTANPTGGDAVFLQFDGVQWILNDTSFDDLWRSGQSGDLPESGLWYNPEQGQNQNVIITFPS